VALLAALPDGDAFSGLVERGIVGTLAGVLQKFDPKEGQQLVLNACSILERLKDTEAVQKARADLEVPLKGALSAYGDAVKEKVEAVMAIFK